MKALLLNDWYMIKKYMRMYLILLAVFTLASIAGDNSILMLYAFLFAGMIPVSLISFGESFKWDKYVDTMPVSRAEYVSSKYVISLMLFASVMLLTTAVQLCKALVGNDESFNAFVSAIPILTTVGLICPAILMPFIFKFGAEKGRIAYCIIIGALCALVVIFFMSEGDTGYTAISFDGFSVLIIIASVIIFALSWLLSVKFYKAREL